MNRSDLTEDAVFLLYVAPFIIAGTHGLLLWIEEGIASSPSQTLFLTVTKDPLTFLLGVVSVCVAFLTDSYSTQPENRRISLRINSRRLQFVAVASLLMSVLFAWIATAYTSNPFRVFSTLLNGRFSLVFPMFLFAISLFLSIPSGLLLAGRKTVAEASGLVLLISAPLAIFLLSRLNYSLGTALVISFSVFAAGLVVLIYGVSRRPS